LMDNSNHQYNELSPRLAEDHGGKELRVIGKETFSTEKVINTLGIDESAISEAESCRAEKHEENLQKLREMESIKNRRGISHKAIEILGHDFSNEKVKSTLGISQEELDSAFREKTERQESVFRKKRSMSLNDRRNNSKALEVLGHDPSRNKALQTLGMKEEEFAEYQDQKAEEYSEELERRRSNSWLNRRMTTKAQRVLGLFPSKEKIMDRLGIDSTIIDGIELELYEKVEEAMRKKRMREVRINKRSYRKALKVLGHDPSEEILQNLLGVDKETLQRELTKNHSGITVPYRIPKEITLEQKIFIGSVLVASLGFFLYSYRNSGGSV